MFQQHAFPSDGEGLEKSLLPQTAIPEAGIKRKEWVWINKIYRTKVQRLTVHFCEDSFPNVFLYVFLPSTPKVLVFSKFYESQSS